MKNNQKGFSVVEIFIVIVVIGLIGAVGWLVYSRQKSKSNNKETTTQTNQQEIYTVSDSNAQIYKSKLYPSLTFAVPSGWQVYEPIKYDVPTKYHGPADSVIKVTKGTATLRLKFYTRRVGGFEGYTCYRYDDLVKIKWIYRFTDKKGVINYMPGISSTDREWEQASSGEFGILEDSNPNYCNSYPSIAKYRSTLDYKDYSDPNVLGAAPPDEAKILVHVSAYVNGDITQDILADTDAIISSFIKSVDDGSNF